MGRLSGEDLKGVHGWRSGWAREKQNGWSDTMVIRTHSAGWPIWSVATLDGDELSMHDLHLVHFLLILLQHFTSFLIEPTDQVDIIHRNFCFGCYKAQWDIET